MKNEHNISPKAKHFIFINILVFVGVQSTNIIANWEIILFKMKKLPWPEVASDFKSIVDKN